MTQEETTWWLRQLPGLDAADETHLSALAADWETLVVNGRTFLSEARPVDGLYMLVEGQVEVVRADPDGQQVVVGMVQPPDLLGFTGVLTDKAAIASARARGRAVLLRLPADQARAILDRDDKVSAVLRRALLVALARRMAQANRIFARLSATAKVEEAEAPLLV